MVWEGHTVGISSEPCEEAALTHSTCIVLWRKLIWSACSVRCSFSWPLNEAGKKPLDDMRCPDLETHRESGPFSRVFIGVCKAFFSSPFRLGPASTVACSNKSSEHPLTPRQPPLSAASPFILVFSGSLGSSGPPRCPSSPLLHLPDVCPSSPKPSFVTPPPVSNQPCPCDAYLVCQTSSPCFVSARTMRPLPSKLPDNWYLSSLCLDGLCCWSHLGFRL